MSDNAEPTAASRPASCKADVTKEFATCERCALAWDPRVVPPACVVMTPRRAREVLQRMVSRYEASHEATLEIARADPRAADPVPPLHIAQELKWIERLLDRVFSNEQIMKILRAGHG